MTTLMPLSNASTFPKSGNQALVEVLHEYESQTARGHSIVAQPGERYVLVDQTDDNWWYVAKQLHAVNDGFYLPRTYVKPLATSVNAVGNRRPQSMTLPASTAGMRFTHNASVDGVTRRTGFWLAPNARQSTITTTALETFTTELTPPADDEPIYYNSADAVQSLPRATGQAPVPSPTAQPLRVLQDGWAQYRDAESDRTFYYHAETETSAWKPPRGLATPAQVDAMQVSSDSAANSDLDDDNEAHANSAYETPASSEVPSDSGKAPPKAPSPRLKPRHLVGKHSSSTASSENGLDVEVEQTPEPVRRATIAPVAPLRQGIESREGRALSVEPELHKSSKISELADALQRTLSVEQAAAVAGLKALKQGFVEKCKVCNDTKAKRVWTHCYAYLNTQHMIFYKDQKSAQRVRQYETPLGAIELRGGKVSWVEGDKKRKHAIEILLYDGEAYQLSLADEQEANSWFHAVNSAIRRLPAMERVESEAQRRSLFLPQTKGSVQQPSTSVAPIPKTGENQIRVSLDNVHSAAGPQLFDSGERRKQRRSFKQVVPNTASSTSSAPPTTSTTCTVEQQAASQQKATILEKLRRFFRARPSLETVIARGIYKPEPVFGSSLVLICEREKLNVPRFVAAAIEAIEQRDLDSDGLYRISGNLSAVQKIRCQVDQDKYTALINESDVHVLTGALKLFFRELQEPAIPTDMHAQFLNAIRKTKPKERRADFVALLRGMPRPHHDTVQRLFAHLLRVAAHSSKNRMQIHNLAIVFGPTLFASSGGPLRKSSDDNKKKKGFDANRSGAAATGAPSNSHLAYHMIMHGQIVEYMLNDYDALFA